MRQLAVLRFLEEHPFSRGKEIAKELGITRSAVERLLAAIRKTCETEGLPQVVRLGKSQSRHALGWKFAWHFGLRHTRPSDPAMIFVGRVKRRVYRYYAKHPGATLVKAAGKIGIGYRQLHGEIREINAILTQAGYPPLEPGWVRPGAVKRLKTRPGSPFSPFSVA